MAIRYGRMTQTKQPPGFPGRFISGLIVFHALLTVLVGAKWLNFDNLQWFITAVTVENFLQVVGMGYVAVKFLFSDQSKTNKMLDNGD